MDWYRDIAMDLMFIAAYYTVSRFKVVHQNKEGNYEWKISYWRPKSYVILLDYFI